MPWLGGLDGLRAIAVLLVVAFHLETKAWVPGGFIGVDLFFVLSGFLISTLLLAEHERTGRVDLKAFYWRRARRLIPALVATLGLVSIVSLWVFAPDSRHHPTAELYDRSVLAALAYGFNWLIALDVPFLFSLVHLWSLAIEEQFYIVWPALFLLLLKARVSIPRIRLVVGGLIGLSISIPFWYWSWDPIRLYYGSDYRAHALLAGCLLALLRHDADWRQRIGRDRMLGATAGIGAAFLAFVALTADLDTPLMYLGGFPIVALCSAIIVLWAVESEETSLVRRALDSPPLVWLGQRSYGFYLYHLPLVIWSFDLGMSVFDQSVLVLGATGLIAAASHRWIERPIVEGRGLQIGSSRRAGASRQPDGPDPQPGREKVVAT